MHFVIFWRECGHGWTNKARSPAHFDTHSMNLMLCCMSILLSAQRQMRLPAHSAAGSFHSAAISNGSDPMNRKLALTLVLAVGVLLPFVDMAYQRLTTGRVDHKAAFLWFWRTLISASLLFLALGLYQGAFSAD
jgi:hypothetical protein